MSYQQKIEAFLSASCAGPVEIAPELIEEFGEACKSLIAKQFFSKNTIGFGLRMSNIGQDIRQLHLQKLYGRKEVSVDTKLRMIHGDIVEALWILIIKASGIKVLEQQKHVTLDVDGVSIPGTLDLIVLNEETGEPEVIDIKSTSYIKKFLDIMSVHNDDSFGYIPQLFGYSEAAGVKAGGLWVFDKVGGGFKILEVATKVYDLLKWKALSKIKETVNHFKNNKEIPPCTGVVDEMWRGKPTGNKILGDNCKFCNYKEICHPGISMEHCRKSEAKDKPIKWYLN